MPEPTMNEGTTKRLPMRGCGIHPYCTGIGRQFWKYVGVRRCFLCLEELIHENTQWAAYEPNIARHPPMRSRQSDAIDGPRRLNEGIDIAPDRPADSAMFPIEQKAPGLWLRFFSSPSGGR